MAATQTRSFFYLNYSETALGNDMFAFDVQSKASFSPESSHHLFFSLDLAVPLRLYLAGFSYIRGFCAAASVSK